MTDGYGAHVQAVGFAGLAVQELENDLHEAELKHAEVLAKVIIATGEDPISDSARSALEFTQALLNSIHAGIGVCEQIKRDLNEYGSSFL